jgi:UDP-N-acetylglucosamine--N-acetylmuramyl-(pentapeptide) pyrophosphoryl-undecaprenol N-acetylglucosamine transferase
MDQRGSAFSAAIACGGTGGHLFPGLAVADQLRARGCRVTLLISPKEVDQHAVRNAIGVHVVTLPAVALTGGRQIAFLRGFWKSYRASRALLAAEQPAAVLAMGGFTSAPPVLAGRRTSAKTFLHESNTIPGRANRWLSWIVDHAFVGFSGAAPRLHTRHVTVSGTPVRTQFHPRDATECRAALGLDPLRPTVLVMGGSQGASGINDLVMQALPLVTQRAPQAQWFHLAGVKDGERVRAEYARLGLPAVVHAFFDAMELALGAATVAVSRAGASSLAELAAVQTPALLVPFPAAADNHQFHNARAFEQSGAALLVEQRSATPESLAQGIVKLLADTDGRARMRTALARWHSPHAAEQIAEALLNSIRGVRPAPAEPTAETLRRHQSVLT